MFTLSDFIGALLITLVGYGVFPVLFASLWHKEIAGGRYRVICFIVNFVVAVVFMVRSGAASVNAFPYILWTYTFSYVGKRILNSRGLLFSW